MWPIFNAINSSPQRLYPLTFEGIKNNQSVGMGHESGTWASKLVDELVLVHASYAW